MSAHDIDFAELDAAVNSLMSSAERPAERKKQPSHPLRRTVVHKRRVAASHRSATARASSVTAKHPTDQPLRTPRHKAPAVKRSAQFMDMVDASADLNPLRSSAAAKTRPKVKKTVSKHASELHKSHHKTSAAPTSSRAVKTGTTSQPARLPSPAAGKSRNVSDITPPKQISKAVWTPTGPLPEETEVTSRDTPAISIPTSNTTAIPASPSSESSVEFVTVRRGGKESSEKTDVTDAAMLATLLDELSSPTPVSTTAPAIASLDAADHDDVRPAAAFGATPSVDFETTAVTNKPNKPQVDLAIEIPKRSDATLVSPSPAPANANGPINVSFTAPTQQPVTPPEAHPLADSSVTKPQFEDTTTTTTTTQAQLPSSSQPSVVESPFVVDAQVEKRPLNANVTTPDAGVSLPVSKTGNQDQPVATDQSAAIERSVVTEQPVRPEPVTTLGSESQMDLEAPELSSELIAIEATGKTADEVSGEEQPEQDDLDELIIVGETMSSTTRNTAVGPGSITPQYQAGVSSGDPSHTPIYDTTQYADPVVHPKQKTSGWVWTLGVLSLLALGSGGAVVLYFMGIIP